MGVWGRLGGVYDWAQLASISHFKRLWRLEWNESGL